MPNKKRSHSNSTTTMVRLGLWQRHRRLRYVMGLLIFGLLPMLLFVIFWLGIKTDLVADYFGYRLDRALGVPVSVRHVEAHGIDGLRLDGLQLFSEAGGVSARTVTFNRQNGGFAVEVEGLIVNVDNVVPEQWRALFSRLRRPKSTALASGSASEIKSAIKPSPTASVSEGGIRPGGLQSLVIHDGVLTKKIPGLGMSHLFLDGMSFVKNQKNGADLSLASGVFSSSGTGVDAKAEQLMALGFSIKTLESGAWQLLANKLSLLGKKREGSVLSLQTLARQGAAGWEFDDVRLAWDKHLSLKGDVALDRSLRPSQMTLKGGLVDVEAFSEHYQDVLTQYAPAFKAGRIDTHFNLQTPDGKLAEVRWQSDLRNLRLKSVLSGDLAIKLKDQALELHFALKEDFDLGKGLSMLHDTPLDVSGRFVKNNGRLGFKGFVNSLNLGYDNPLLGDLEIPSMKPMIPLKFSF